MSTPEIPKEVVEAAARAFYDAPDDTDVRKLGLQAMLVDYIGKAELLRMLTVAYSAGRESAYTRDEWRANNGALMWGHSEIRAQTEDFLDASRDAWLEHRRTGATEWQRVDQAGERQQSEAAADA